mgnify:CR=1 FL=1
MPQPHGAEYFGFKRSLDLLKDGIGGLVRVDMDHVTGAAELIEAEDWISHCLVGVEPAMSCFHRVVVALPQGIVVCVAEAATKWRFAEQVVDSTAGAATPAGAEAVDENLVGNVHVYESRGGKAEAFEDLMEV